MLTKDNLVGRIQDGEQFKKKGVVISQGQELHYTMITDEFLFMGENGEPDASMVVYSYFLNGAEDQNRPVLFVLTGGPGASIGDLHIGMYGAKVYDYGDETSLRSHPPYRYKDNDDWILDTCDIVLFDSVGTGMSRLLNPDAAVKFYGHEQDNYSLSRAIAHWIEKYDRMNSPKFINGVSYGGQRCCLLPRYLFGGIGMPGGETLGITLNGIIMMADVSLLDTNADETSNDETIVTDAAIPDICFQTSGYAATNWYHHPEGKPDQEQFMDEAYQFAFGPLREVLTDPNADAGQKAKVAEQLSWYIGIPADQIFESDFKVDMFDYSYRLAMAAEGKAVGIYDSRYTLPIGAINTPTFDMIADDASLSSSWGVTYAVTAQIYKNEYGLHFADGRYHIGQNFAAYAEWDWHIQEGTRPIDWQVYNMRHHKDLKLMIVSGIYDIVWNHGYSRYTYESMGLPEDRTVFKAYPAGHAMYIDKESRHMMAADFRAFIKSAL